MNLTGIKKRRLSALILLAVLTFSIPATAQVTVGSGEEPAKGALLDIKSANPTAAGGETTREGGLLFPRISLTATNRLDPIIADADADAATKLNYKGLTVYNLNATTGGFRSEGLFTWDGAQWVSGGGDSDWFYLPSFNLDLDVDTTIPGDETKTIDLYNDVYLKQFTKAGNTGYVVSDNAPAGSFNFAPNKPLYALNQLVFVVTDYDQNAITITGITNGIMTYEVKDTNPPASSYINIICVVK